MSESPLEKFVRLANERHVRTPAGVEQFHLPINSLIGESPLDYSAHHAFAKAHGTAPAKFAPPKNFDPKAFATNYKSKYVSKPKPVGPKATGPFAPLSKEERGHSGDRPVWAPTGERFYGRYGASGLLPRHKDEQGNETFLLGQRGKALSNGGKWSTIGGAMDEHETPQSAAGREAVEELGIPEHELSSMKQVGENVFSHPAGVSYHTALVDTPKQLSLDPDFYQKAEMQDARYFTRAELKKMQANDELLGPLANSLDSHLAAFDAADAGKAYVSTPYVHNEAPKANLLNPKAPKKILDESSFWHDILDGVKTISGHAKDGKYNREKLIRLRDAKDDLQEQVDNPAGVKAAYEYQGIPYRPAVHEAMLKHYLDVVKKAEDALTKHEKVADVKRFVDPDAPKYQTTKSSSLGPLMEPGKYPLGSGAYLTVDKNGNMIKIDAQGNKSSVGLSRESSIEKILRLTQIGDDDLIQLHGHKGEPGYELLHSPNTRIRAIANKIYLQGGQAAVAKELGPAAKPTTHGLRETTDPKDWVRLKIQKTGYPKLRVSDDPNASLLGIATDTKGREKHLYSAAHKNQNASIKFSRVKNFHEKVPALDVALKRDAMKDDTAAAVLLMRVTAMRPGSLDDTGADKQAYGATTLLNEHLVVSADGKSVKFIFIGKGGKPLNLETNDAFLVRVLKARKNKTKPGQSLFNTSGDKALKYVKLYTGNEFLVKDLRTYRANAIAQMLIKKHLTPKTKTEFNKARREIAIAVSDILGNTPAMALSSYIDPVAFDKWIKDESWV